MDRRNWMRFALTSMALAVGVVVLSPAPARAELEPNVVSWLDDRYGEDGWIDGGHVEEPFHMHAIFTPTWDYLGMAIEYPVGTWKFYPAGGGPPVTIP